MLVKHKILVDGVLQILFQLLFASLVTASVLRLPQDRSHPPVNLSLPLNGVAKPGLNTFTLRR